MIDRLQFELGRGQAIFYISFGSIFGSQNLLRSVAEDLLSVPTMKSLCPLTVALAIVVVALPAAGAYAQGNGNGQQKVAVCHIPPGNPANGQTLTLPEPAVKAHLAHGDTLGACGGAGTATGRDRGRGNQTGSEGNVGRGRGTEGANNGNADRGRGTQGADGGNAGRDRGTQSGNDSNSGRGRGRGQK